MLAINFIFFVCTRMSFVPKSHIFMIVSLYLLFIYNEVRTKVHRKVKKRCNKKATINTTLQCTSEPWLAYSDKDEEDDDVAADGDSEINVGSVVAFCTKYDCTQTQISDIWCFLTCVYSNEIHYVNLHFTYLLTYLLVHFCVPWTRVSWCSSLLKWTLLMMSRVTTCLENLEMSGNYRGVREMSGISLKVMEMSGNCQGKNLVMENCVTFRIFHYSVAVDDTAFMMLSL